MKLIRKKSDASELWKAEVLAKLKEPRCWICSHLLNDVHRDFFWFVSEQYYEIGMIDKLRLAYGFCPAHTRHFLQTGAHSVNITVFSYLTWYAIARLNAARDLLLDGGSKRDPRQLCLQAARTLRPPGICPMCDSRHRGEQTDIHMMIKTLELRDVRGAYERSAGLCIPHVVQAGERAGWDTLAFLSNDLRRRLQSKIFPGRSTGGLLEQTVGLDKERSLRQRGSRANTEIAAPGGNHGVERYVEPPACPWSPTFDQLLSSLAEPGCPVCRACEAGLQEYLSWLAREVEQHGSEASNWDLSWRVCPSHLWELDIAGYERSAIIIAEHMIEDWLSRLQRLNDGLSARPPDRWLQRVGVGYRRWHGRLDRDSSDTEARHRSRWRKVMTALETPQERLNAMRAIAFRGQDCQACIHVETTAVRRLELILRALEDPAGRNAYHAGWGLCLRHCVKAARVAEVPAALSELLSAQIARLRLLEWELHEATRKDNWSVRYEAKGGEKDVWRRAAYQFCGV